MTNLIRIITVTAASLLIMAAPAAATLEVVATTADLGALARAVGGEDVDVQTIARPTEDPHFVDAKPSYAKLLNGADVLIEGGAALESGWLPPLLATARNAKIGPGVPGRVVASENVSLSDVPAQLSRALGDVHPFGNPHYLLDPVNGGIVAGTIAEAFAVVDPPNAAHYRANLERFRSTLQRKLADWEELMRPFRGLAVVTYHKDFDYLAERFGLVIVGNLEPKPGIPPSPAHVAELVPRMRAANVKLVIIEPNRERKVADFVAEQAGAKLLVLPIMPGVSEAADYVDLIDYDLRQIAGAAGGP